MRKFAAAILLCTLATPAFAQQLEPAEQIQELQVTLNQEFHIAHELALSLDDQRVMVTTLKGELAKLRTAQSAQAAPKPETSVPAKP